MHGVEGKGIVNLVLKTRFIDKTMQLTFYIIVPLALWFKKYLIKINPYFAPLENSKNQL
jgi:hypothetical protein